MAGIKTGANETAELIKSLHAKGVSYQSMADNIGVSWMTIHRWANGDTHPRPAGPINLMLAGLLTIS